jgi:hypothetical protein
MKASTLVLIMFTLQLTSLNAFAQDRCTRESLRVQRCQATTIYDPRTGRYQGCNIEAPDCREYMIANIAERNCQCQSGTNSLAPAGALESGSGATWKVLARHIPVPPNSRRIQVD